jgi:hypothetical protein
LPGEGETTAPEFSGTDGMVEFSREQPIAAIARSKSASVARPSRARMGFAVFIDQRPSKSSKGAAFKNRVDRSQTSEQSPDILHRLRARTVEPAHLSQVMRNEGEMRVIRGGLRGPARPTAAQNRFVITQVERQYSDSCDDERGCIQELAAKSSARRREIRVCRPTKAILVPASECQVPF